MSDDMARSMEHVTATLWEIIEAVSTLSARIYELTGVDGLEQVVIDRELALRLGLLPGQSMEIAASCGMVRIASDPIPESERLMWRGLREGVVGDDGVMRDFDRATETRRSP
jgi:hypothetical protein